MQTVQGLLIFIPTPSVVIMVLFPRGRHFTYRQERGRGGAGVEEKRLPPVNWSGNSPDSAELMRNVKGPLTANQPSQLTQRPILQRGSTEFIEFHTFSEKEKFCLFF